MRGQSHKSREKLQQANCVRIFAEQITGARRDQPELERLLDYLRSGDVVVVTRLDRLARSTRDLLDIAERLRRIGSGLRSLAEPWADTTTPAGRMVLTVFAGIAEFERSLIAECTKTGQPQSSSGRSSVSRRGLYPRQWLTGSLRRSDFFWADVAAFRSDSDEPLQAVAITRPPWPGEGEAYEVEGIW